VPVFSGYVDAADVSGVIGWSDPPSEVTVFVNGASVGNAQIAGARPDAQEAGYREAAGFFLQIARYLKPGKNTIEVVFPNGDPVPGSPNTIDYDPAARIDLHWSSQYAHKTPLILRWWQDYRIVSHINKRVCGEAIPGQSHGLYRWLLRDFGPFPLKHGVSVGCGEATKEIDVVKLGIVERFDLFELSSVAIETGRQAAENVGLADRMSFHHGNALERPGTYDMVFWNNSLHHMFNVDEAVAWSFNVLRPGGLFVFDEYVGPTRMQFSEFVLGVNTLYRRLLSHEYLIDPCSSDQILDVVHNVDVDALLALDPSEAADSDNILPSINKHFPNAIIKPTGGCVYHIGLNDILHNLRDDEAEIARALMLDDQLTERGLTQYAVGIARKPAKVLMTRGMIRLNVGCGPHHRKEGWHNIDIRPFPGVDEVRDATLPFDDIAPLEYVYCEHFLEHLTLEAAVQFLQNSAFALAPNGRIRISTPALEWVLATHFNLSDETEEQVVMATLVTNRAFHGWGHQFIWSKPMLRTALRALGFENVTFWGYGESDDPNLVGLEQHGDYYLQRGWPSVWIAEGVRGTYITLNNEFISQCESILSQYVRAGH
jgi:predicted SAM-dependent methyltransferase/SAM-dependent methyltransferase